MCDHDKLKKHGKDRKGCQRWKCRNCGSTVTNGSHKRPLGDMRIDLDDATRILNMLLEGMSIRACERITGIAHKTICDLVLYVGQNCDQLLEATVTGVAAKFIELDEIWDFVFAKEKTALKRNLGEGAGDS